MDYTQVLLLWKGPPADIHLAEVMATKKATLRVSRRRLHEFNGSNSLKERDSSILPRSHVGYLRTTGVFRFVAPLMNLRTTGCCARESKKTHKAYSHKYK